MILPELAIEWLRNEKEKAWNEGYQACKNGGEKTDNPYRKREKK